MAVEIERKFLVSGEIPDGEKTDIVQGYLSLDRGRTIRVRIESGVATINVKGRTEGYSRVEFEYPVPLDDAREMMELCIGSPIEKTRRRVPHGGFIWEVDVFRGANEGLIVAEIELESEADTFEIPDWIGAEVTKDPRYFNSMLMRNPFCEWVERDS